MLHKTIEDWSEGKFDSQSEVFSAKIKMKNEKQTQEGEMKHLEHWEESLAGRAACKS